MTHAPSMLVSRSLDDDAAIQIIEFISELTRVLHSCGTPAHRLEASIEACSLTLGLTCQCLASPGAVRLAFGAGVRQRMLIVRVPEVLLHLEHLTLVDEVATRVASGTLHPHEGLSELSAIINAPTRYPPLLTAAAHGLVAASAARLFDGTFWESACAALAGVCTGALVYMTSRSARTARLLEAAAGAVAGVIGLVAALYAGPASSLIITLSGLLLILPGLALTIAVNELSMRHLVSGTARLMGAVISFVSLGFGLALGRGAMLAFAESATPEAMEVAATHAINPGTKGIALLTAAIGFTIVFRARPRDVVVIAIAGILGFAGARLGTEAIGGEVGVSLGALLIGLVGAGYTRYYDRPAVVPVLPGIMVLVPGAVGLGGVNALIDQNVELGINTGFKVVMIAVAISAGLVMANAIIPPRKAL